ncbi:MAG: hypothetical protein JWP97_699 [Labilithrix sp.]|nr:hypothetical protein [Labilithrix sp.]
MTTSTTAGEQVLGKVLVTAATGSVGAEVVSALVARGLPFRAVDLSREAVRALHGDVDVGVLDFHDPSTFDGVLAGCASLFLVRPSAVDQMESTILPFIDAAVAAGVRHVVFLSVLGADTNRQVPHHAIEKHLAERGMSYTLLRPGFFAQNLGAAYRADIVDDGRLFVPAGRGRFAFVDIRDVAELAALVFADPDPHRGAAYTCTGAAVLSFEEAARLLSDVIHRTVRYEAASLASYVRHLSVQGLPLPQIAVQTVLHVGLRSGQLETTDPTLERLLGRAPRTLAAYLRENARLWSRDVSGRQLVAAAAGSEPEAAHVRAYR